MNAIQLLDRILDPVADAFSPEVARRILALRSDDELQARIDELATKSNKGELTDEELVEYKSYVDVIDGRGACDGTSVGNEQPTTR